MRPGTSYLNEDELRLVGRRCRAPGQPSTCAFCARTIQINAVREVLVDRVLQPAFRLGPPPRGSRSPRHPCVFVRALARSHQSCLGPVFRARNSGQKKGQKPNTPTVGVLSVCPVFRPGFWAGIRAHEYRSLLGSLALTGPPPGFVIECVRLVPARVMGPLGFSSRGLTPAARERGCGVSS